MRPEHEQLEVERHRPASVKHGDRPRLVTDSDREVLAFVAAHRLVLATHIQALLGVSERIACGRLAALEAAGLLRHDRMFHSQPGCYRITRPGLAAIGSELSPPSVDLHSYREQIGVAWVWLAASHGYFGDDVDRVMSNLELRSRDRARTDAEQAADRSEPRTTLSDPDKPPFGVSLDGIGPGAPTRRHYPDLLLIKGQKRVAIELELSLTGRRRLEQNLAGYRAEPGIDAVLYYVDDTSVGQTVRSAARDVGISARVHVQRARFPEP